jgi:hypothetical protein
VLTKVKYTAGNFLNIFKCTVPVVLLCCKFTLLFIFQEKRYMNVFVLFDAGSSHFKVICGLHFLAFFQAGEDFYHTKFAVCGECFISMRKISTSTSVFCRSAILFVSDIRIPAAFLL